MVASHADHVTGLQRDVLAVARLVWVDCDLIVGVLAAEVVDIIQGVEEGRGVWVQHLHDLVGDTANLSGDKRQ